MKNKVTCILMEITLASNGSTLSDRALTILGELARLHDFGIVVDEVCFQQWRNQKSSNRLWSL